MVLKPVPERISELNQEYPPWLLRDPKSNAGVREPLRIEKMKCCWPSFMATARTTGAIRRQRKPLFSSTSSAAISRADRKRVRCSEPRTKAAAAARRPDRRNTRRHCRLSLLCHLELFVVRPEDVQGTAEAGPFHSRELCARTRKPLRAHAQKTPVAITVEELKAKLNNNEPVAIIDVRAFGGVRRQQKHHQRRVALQTAAAQEPFQVCSLEERSERSRRRHVLCMSERRGRHFRGADLSGGWLHACAVPAGRLDGVGKK